jgi:uncharacterized protein YbjT (DUF2867 family)
LDKGEAVASLATPVLGDLMRPETLEPAFHRAERVFILAPPAPEMETLERNAIDAAVAAGVKRIVYLSNFAAIVLPLLNFAFNPQAPGKSAPIVVWPLESRGGLTMGS